MMYLWLKAAHVASVLLFVGDTLALLLASTALGTRRIGGPDPGGDLRAAVRWWDARVTLPAMVGAWGFGLWAAVTGGWFSEPWLQTKILFIILISGVHGTLAGRLRRFDPEAAAASVRPTPMLAGLTLASVLCIVVLAVVKPG